MNPSPKHKLTPSERGWYKRVAGKSRWVCSFISAPTGELADAIFEDRFKELARPKPKDDGAPKLLKLVTEFMAMKVRAGATGKLYVRTVAEYHESLKLMLSAVGSTDPRRLTPRHFALIADDIAHFGLDRRAKHIINIRSFFNWLVEMDIIATAPRYGPQFQLPTAKERRKAKAQRKREHGGSMTYDASEVKRILAHAKPIYRAMILLGLNAAYGNADIARLPRNIVGRSWLEFERGKTGAERRCKLWPETRHAVARVMKLRLHVDLVFATRFGAPFVTDKKRDQIGTRFTAICRLAGVQERGFYGLRRTFRTVADETGDERSAKLIMGHSDRREDVGGMYIHDIIRERLERVSDHVRRRLQVQESYRQAIELEKKRESERQLHARAMRVAANGRQNARRKLQGRSDRPRSIAQTPAGSKQSDRPASGRESAQPA